MAAKPQDSSSQAEESLTQQLPTPPPEMEERSEESAAQRQSGKTPEPSEASPKSRVEINPSTTEGQALETAKAESGKGSAQASPDVDTSKVVVEEKVDNQPAESKGNKDPIEKQSDKEKSDTDESKKDAEEKKASLPRGMKAGTLTF